MKFIEKVPVPATPEQDVNKDSTIWIGGKCVAMVEGRQTVAYLLHETYTVTNEHGEEEVQVKAAEVRVDSPLTEIKLIEAARNVVKSAISKYDTSPAVNSFILEGRRMWIDKATRSGLMLRLNAESASGEKTTTLWYEGYPISLPVDSAISMLNQLEVYASQCYDKTQEHLSAISFLSNPEQIMEYDYTEGYPEFLEF
ncbi:MAG: DUF4376 domain-containing protein [Parabacteroides sp.]